MLLKLLRNQKRFCKKTICLLLLIALTGQLLIPSAKMEASAKIEPVVMIQKPVGPVSDSGYQALSYFYEDGTPYTPDRPSPAQTLKGRAATRTLPTSYDLRDEGAVTSVKNQGNTNTCWAFSAIGAIESNLLKNGAWNRAKELDFSEVHLAWFSYTPISDVSSPLYGDHLTDSYKAKLISSTSSSDPLSWGGSPSIASSTLSSWTGAELESAMPFAASSSSFASYEDKRYHSYAHLQNTNSFLNGANSTPETTRAAIKDQLMNAGAMTLSYMHNDYYLNETTVGGNAYYCNTKYSSNHAVLLIGWDDNYSKYHFRQTPSSNGAWLIKNSWGSSQLGSGYMWISYEDNTISEIVSLEAESPDNYDHNYQYNGAFTNYGIRYAELPIKFCNVFTIKGENGANQQLTAVGIETKDASTGYTIKIHRNMSNGVPSESPDEIVSTISGTITWPGFHTIPLDMPVILANGEVFGVEVSFEAQKFYPIEKSSDLYTYHSNAKETFFYDPNLNRWTDSQDRSFGNACIKAYTLDTLLEIPVRPTPTPSPDISPAQSPKAPDTRFSKIAPIALGKGESIQSNQLLPPNYTITSITSQNPSVVSVSKNKIRALKTGNTLLIFQTAQEQTITCKIYVKKAPKKIKLSISKKTLRRRKSFQIRIKSFAPSGSASYKVAFKSSRPKIVKVNSIGKITAVKSGWAYITVSSFNGKKARCRIIVPQK